MSEVVNDNVAEISTGVPVKQGDRVLVAIVDGEPAVISVEGAGDELDAKIEQASNRIGSLSAAVAENAKAAADARQGAADAAEIANAASNAAESAQSTADAAKSAASTAQTTADTAKNSAAAAQTTADAASTAAGKAQTTADAASAQANATASHFWMDAAGQANVSTGAGTVETGHSVTIGSKGIIQRLDGKMMQSLTKTALNFYLAQSGTPLLAAMYTPDGMGVFAAGKQLSSFTGSGAVFYDGTTAIPTTDNVTASFGNYGAVIGKAESAHIEISPSSIAFSDGATKMGYVSDSRLNMSAGDFNAVSVGKYVLRVDSNGTFVLGM